MPNKRKHRRFVKRCDTDIISNNVTFKGFSSDFSINGLFLRTSHPLTPDTVINIVVHLPDGNASKLKGRVKRILKPSRFKAERKDSKKEQSGKSVKLVIPSKSLKSKKPAMQGMGLEIIEKDAGYLHFIRSLLYGL